MKFRVVHYYNRLYVAQYSRLGLFWSSIPKATCWYDDLSLLEIGPLVGTFDEMQSFVKGMSSERLPAWRLKQRADLTAAIKRVKQLKRERKSRSYVKP